MHREIWVPAPPAFPLDFVVHHLLFDLLNAEEAHVILAAGQLQYFVVVFEANWARVRIDLAQNAIRLSLAEFQELFIIVRLDIYFLDFGPSLLTKCVVLSMNLIHSVLVVPTCWARMLLVRVGYVSLLVLVPALLNEDSVVEAFAQPCEEV